MIDGAGGRAGMGGHAREEGERGRDESCAPHNPIGPSERLIELGCGEVLLNHKWASFGECSLFCTAVHPCQTLGSKSSASAVTGDGIYIQHICWPEQISIQLRYVGHGRVQGS